MADVSNSAKKNTSVLKSLETRIATYFTITSACLGKATRCVRRNISKCKKIVFDNKGKLIGKNTILRLHNAILYGKLKTKSGLLCHRKLLKVLQEMNGAINGLATAKQKKRANELFLKYQSRFEEIVHGKKLTSSGISFDEVLNKSRECGGHASTLAGVRCVKGKYEYLIRNSWGKGCSSYKGNSEITCDKKNSKPTGQVWVKEKTILNNMYEYTYLK